MSDDLRPAGKVEVTCACGVSFWVDALDKRLPDGPFKCAGCSDEPIVLDRRGFKPTYQLLTDSAGLRCIETECPGRGCVKPYRIDENHPDFRRVLASLKRNDRSTLFCYHRARN